MTSPTRYCTSEISPGNVSTKKQFLLVSPHKHKTSSRIADEANVVGSALSGQADNKAGDRFLDYVTHTICEEGDLSDYWVPAIIYAKSFHRRGVIPL